MYISCLINLGKRENSHGAMCGDFICVECVSKNCCTSWLNVPVHCHDEFTVQQTAIFLVNYGKLHHRDILVLQNKIYGL